MAFTIASAPHGHSQQTTTTMMRMVLLALLPGVAVQVHFFGYGVIIQLLLATLTALLTESLVLLLRQRPIGPALRDSSAILTAALLAVAAILAAMMRRFGFERTLVSETDILDGLAFEMLGVR